MIPVNYYNNIPQFTSDQVEQHGTPDKYGYDKFFILEGAQPLVSDYKMEKDYILTKRPIHRYSGLERFKLTLGHLIGATFGLTEMALGEEPWPDILYKITKLTPENLWEGTRKLLKEKNMKLYFNRIPSIITYAGWRNCTTNISTGVFKRILEDFEKLYIMFHKSKDVFKRSYFLNMRFVAIKLMERYQVNLAIRIPCLRSKVKYKELHELYDKLWSMVIEEEEKDLLDFFAD